MSENIHHILHTRAQHEATVDGRALRRSLGMLARMDVFAHRELHRECPNVPVLGHYMQQLVRSKYVPHGDPMVGMENYMFAVESAIKHPRAHRIDRELGQLVISAIEIQRPFVRGGLIDRDW